MAQEYGNCVERRRFLFALGFMILLSSMAIASDHTDHEQIRLEGVWRATGMMKAGQMQPFEGDTTYSFKQGTLEIHAPPQPDGRMAYHVDSGVCPHHLNMKWDSSIDAERSNMIYGFDAGHLWVCYAPPGQPRPTSIATDNKNNWTLIVFERQSNPEQIQLTSPLSSLQNNRPLDKAFQWLWGTGGRIDEAISKRFALEAESQGEPGGRMWTAYGRYCGAYGFKRDIKASWDVACEVFPALLKSAEKGNLNDHFLLGLVFRSGLGVVKPDTEAAIEFCHIAALQGHSPSMLYLGYAYEKKNDQNTSRYWHALGALFGNALAMNEYGICCYAGLGGPKETEQAMVWFNRSAAIGYPMAVNNLGAIAYESKDFGKSLEDYREAAKEGVVPAMYNLGLQYYDGLGVDRDVDEARRWIALAAKQGHSQAEVTLKSMEKHPSTNAYFNPYSDNWGPSPDAEAAAQRAAARAVRRYRQQRNGW